MWLLALANGITGLEKMGLENEVDLGVLLYATCCFVQPGFRYDPRLLGSAKYEYEHSNAQFHGNVRCCRRHVALSHADRRQVQRKERHDRIRGYTV